MNPLHKEILDAIKANSGKPTKQTFLDNYLGTTHPRYPINAPTLHKIAREWKKQHYDLPLDQFKNLLTSLIEGKSSTEKTMAGILLYSSTKAQRKFDPKIFDKWLNHLEGWAEVDCLCTGNYSTTEIPAQFKSWKKILDGFSKSENIHKRRASLVMLCSPIRKVEDPEMAKLAFKHIMRLKKEKSVLITKAISWLLRSMVKLYKQEVNNFLNEHEEALPKIAIRETRAKLRTGKKSGKV
jgi:3-methyladenine DNA glycosylase AlkD